MAGKSKDENNDLPDDDWENDVDDSDSPELGDETLAARPMTAGPRTRDWRDLERFKEERELQKLMQNDYDDL